MKSISFTNPDFKLIGDPLVIKYRVPDKKLLAELILKKTPATLMLLVLQKQMLLRISLSNVPTNTIVMPDGTLHIIDVPLAARIFKECTVVISLTKQAISELILKEPTIGGLLLPRRTYASYTCHEQTQGFTLWILL